MPTVSVRIGLYFLAIVLVGASTTLPVFAEEAGSSGARDEQRQHSGEDAAGSAAKPDQSMPRTTKPRPRKVSENWTPTRSVATAELPNTSIRATACRRADQTPSRIPSATSTPGRSCRRQRTFIGERSRRRRLPIPWCATRSACRSRRAKAGSNMTGSIPML